MSSNTNPEPKFVTERKAWIGERDNGILRRLEQAGLDPAQVDSKTLMKYLPREMHAKDVIYRVLFTALYATVTVGTFFIGVPLVAFWGWGHIIKQVSPVLLVLGFAVTVVPWHIYFGRFFFDLTPYEDETAPHEETSHTEISQAETSQANNTTGDA